MSAAPILPYVWATVGRKPVQREFRPRPLGGLAFYRRRTEILLRRYMSVSMDMGRVPSVMRNLEFRGRASSYRIRNFEDAVIFVIDVEKCLKSLDGFSQELIARIALQEYTQAETAELMSQGVRTITRRYAEILDRLTGLFLDRGLLVPDFPEGCQEEEKYRSAASIKKHVGYCRKIVGRELSGKLVS
jgi:hypothetical protein